MKRKYRTDIEQRMKEILDVIGIEYSEQHPVNRKYGYYCDFYIPSCNLIIECDGEAWHKLGNKRDRTRDIVLTKAGYNIIRFRGNEILNEPLFVLNKIKDILKSSFNCSGNKGQFISIKQQLIDSELSDGNKGGNDIII